jgi:hypothetical protein
MFRASALGIGRCSALVHKALVDVLGLNIMHQLRPNRYSLFTDEPVR